MPTAKKATTKKAATEEPEAAPAVEAARAVEPEAAPVVEAVEATAEPTPEDRVAALTDAAGLQGVSADQVEVAAARVLNRG